MSAVFWSLMELSGLGMIVWNRSIGQALAELSSSRRPKSAEPMVTGYRTATVILGVGLVVASAIAVLGSI